MGWGPEVGEILVTDLDDLDDFDAVVFGAGGGDGPINAVGEVIFEIDEYGDIRLDEQGAPIPLRGWAQTIFVEKVDPFDLANVLADDFFEPPVGNFDGREVDEYPLRVTAVVSYEDPSSLEVEEVTRVTWVVP